MGRGLDKFLSMMRLNDDDYDEFDDYDDEFEEFDEYEDCLLYTSQLFR